MTTVQPTRVAYARTTGILFLVGALAFATAATVLSSTFDWPDILREPASVVLPAYAAGGAGLTWIWFATGWTYAILAVPLLLLLPAVLGLRDDPVLKVATAIGAASVLLSLIGFLRWVFVVPPLAASYVGGDEVTKAAVEAAWIAQHQYGGALLGEHLGQLLALVWSVSLCVLIIRTRVLPQWLGWGGIVVSALYLTGQGDVLATAFDGFPVWDLGGLLGSTGWGLWIAALGVVILAGRCGQWRLGKTEEPMHVARRDPAAEFGIRPLRELAQHVESKEKECDSRCLTMTCRSGNGWLPHAKLLG